MANNHRPNNSDKVSFGDILNPHRTNLAQDGECDEDDDYEDDADFLNGVNYGEDDDDESDAATAKSFDATPTKYEISEIKESPVVDTTPIDPKKKIHTMVSDDATMKIFFNPDHYNVPEKGLMELLFNLAENEHCIDAVGEIPCGIITVRFNPAIQSSKEYGYVGKAIVKFIKTFKEG